MFRRFGARRIKPVFLLVFTFSVVSANLTPVHAVANTNIYIAASGSAGAGTSCASPSYIGGDSIQTAINSIPGLNSESITITICPGFYQPTSPILIDSTTVSSYSGNNQNLIIQGTAGESENTIIDGALAGTTGLFTVNTFANLEVKFLTFQNVRNDSAKGGVFELDVTKPSINFNANTYHYIHNNNFFRNFTNQGGAAIHVAGDQMAGRGFTGILEISDNYFVENDSSFDGGAFSADNTASSTSKVLIRRNLFAFNTAGRAGGGVSSNFSYATIQDNYFYLNESPNGASIYVNGSLTNSGNRIIGTGTSGSKECTSPGNDSTSSDNWADNIYCETDKQTPASTYTLKTTAEILTAKGSLKPRSPSFSISPNNGYVRINLDNRNNGGSSILNYEYSLNNAAYIALSPASGAVSTFDINGLANGTTYAIKVRAINANGTSLPSASVNGTPAASAPGSPTISALRAVSSSSVALDFLAPASDGGSPITSYFCQSLVGSFSVSLSQSASGTCLFTGLSSNTTYSFRIRASNTSGSSAFTISSNITTPLSDAEQKIKDDEQKAENNRIRAAEIIASRAQLLTLLAQGKAPSLELYWLAGIILVNTNTHAPINSQLLSMSVESRTTITAINAVVYKQSVIDKLVTSETLIITTSDLIVAELIDSTTPQKTLICSIVKDLPLSERKTLNEIRAVITAQVLQMQSRMNRIAAIKATLESRRSK
jgi:hypothetical protein